jgi:hypothetical protein
VDQHWRTRFDYRRRESHRRDLCAGRGQRKAGREQAT